MNLYLSVLLHPRKTIRLIVDEDPTHQVLSLFLSVAVADILMQLLPPGAPQVIPVQYAAGGAIVGGVIFGWIALQILGWLYGMTGQWLGGQADCMLVRTALAWTKIPTFIVFTVWIINFVVNRVVFGSQEGEPSVVSMLLDIAYWISIVVFGIWSVVIVCHALGEVHQFSAWKAMLSLMIGNLILFLPIALLAILAAIALPNGAISLSNMRRAQAPPAATTEETGTSAEPKVPLRSNVNLAVQPGRVLLTDGSQLEGRIMYEDDTTVYVETPDRVINVEKSRIKKVERG